MRTRRRPVPARRTVLVAIVAAAAVLGAVAYAVGRDGDRLHSWERVPDPVRPPSPFGSHPEAPLLGLRLTAVAQGLDQPVAAVSQPGTDRMFVLERPGRVRVIESGALRSEPVVDLTDTVSIEDSAERGLVGIALHPGFAENGRVFLSYTDTTTDLVVAEFRKVEGDTFEGPVVELLRVDQPGLYHHGGSMAFGPDGYLWLGLGDGGGGAPDPMGLGQDPTGLQGTLVRIDVDSVTVGEDGSPMPYAVPDDNPFVGDGGAPEVWAYGLRNPWAFTFDSGLIYIADVGHETWEEINVVPLSESAGANFGWSIFEGPECMMELLCDLPDRVDPVVALPREGMCAIIGGPVYRGDAIPELTGRYFYGDHCVGWIRTARFVDGEVVEHYDWTAQLGRVAGLASFFIDGHGEVYVVGIEGSVYRIDAVR